MLLISYSPSSQSPYPVFSSHILPLASYRFSSRSPFLTPLQEMGLAFDEWDLDYYTALFRDDMKRDPTNVELFDIAQSNSEHSRHWFFRGDLVIDGVKMPSNLFDLVKEPWKVRHAPAL